MHVVEVGLLLRADVLGPDGRVLESSAFTELKMDVVGGQASVLTPLRNLGGWREVHLASQETRLEQEGWTLGPLPAGFSLLGAVRKAIALPADPAVRQAPASTVHAVFSDGLARVSVFIEPAQGPGRPAFMTQLGATHTLSQPGGAEHWLTLMGDVPMSTLKAIAGARVLAVLGDSDSLEIGDWVMAIGVKKCSCIVVVSLQAARRACEMLAAMPSLTSS